MWPGNPGLFFWRTAEASACLLNLRLALFHAVDETLQDHGRAIQNIHGVGVCLAAELIRFAKSGLLRVLGKLLRTLGHGVFGNQLFGLLMGVRDDALGLTAGVIHDTVGVRTRVLDQS